MSGPEIEALATPSPASTDWVAVWNLNGIDLRYRGDYAGATSYVDGDIVVYNGITYLCVQPTSAAPVIWPSTSQVYSSRVYRSTAQAIPSATWTNVTFDTVRWDRGAQWSSGSPTRLTCQVAGTYHVYAHVQWNAQATGLQRVAILQKNGSPIVAIGGLYGATIQGGSNPNSPLSTVLDLIPGDYITLLVSQDSGSSVNLVQGDATNWHCTEMGMALIGAGPPGPPGLAANLSYATSLPGSPSDGQEAVLVDSVTNPSYQWRFRFNAGSTSAYKWEFIGGSDAHVVVGADETTTTTGAWLELTTVGPLVTLPRAGDYEAIGGANTYHSAAATVTYFGITNGTTTPPFAAATYNTAVNAVIPSGTSSYRFTGLAANSDIRCRYYNGTAGTAHWTNRWLRVHPVRVS